MNILFSKFATLIIDNTRRYEYIIQIQHAKRESLREGKESISDHPQLISGESIYLSSLSQSYFKLYLFLYQPDISPFTFNDLPFVFVGFLGGFNIQVIIKGQMVEGKLSVRDGILLYCTYSYRLFLLT